MTQQNSYLVTGASGQLGKEWQFVLNAMGAEFNAVGSDVLDITDRKAVFELLRTQKPDILINCAAYTNVDEAENPKSANDAVNYQGVKNLAEACAETETLLVHYSTDYVFCGNLTDQNSYPNGYSEDAPLSPVNAYGRSKLKGEQAIRDSGVCHLILRISWLCSALGNNFLKTMLRASTSGQQLKVVSDQIGSPAFTFDVVDFTCKLINLEQTGTFHIQCDETISWYEFAEMIFREAGIDVDLTPVNSDEWPVKAKRPAFSKLDTRKLKHVAGINEIPVTEGIRRVLNEPGILN